MIAHRKEPADLLDLDLLVLDLPTLDALALRKRWRGLLSLLTTTMVDAAMNTYARENFIVILLLL